MLKPIIIFALALFTAGCATSSPSGRSYPEGRFFLYSSAHDVAKVSHAFIREPILYEQAFFSPLHIAELMQDLKVL